MDDTTPQLGEFWDSHFHVLDPINSPYKTTRTYTPEGATLESLLSTSLATHFLIVQASVEDGTTATLSHLRRARHEHPDKVFRAEIDLDIDAGELDDRALREMHDIGVRSLRLHGEIGVAAEDRSERIQTRFQALAKVARKTGWSISAMCSLDVWLCLGTWLTTCPDLDGVKIIIEHSGRPDATRDLAQYPEFDRFLQLLEQNQGRLFIKLCGINRLDPTLNTHGRMEHLPACIVAIAERVPDSIVWGSDWPHVQYEVRDADGKPVPGREVDIQHELVLLKRALTADTWRKMMIGTPGRLFQ